MSDQVLEEGWRLLRRIEVRQRVANDLRKGQRTVVTRVETTKAGHDRVMTRTARPHRTNSRIVRL